MEEVSQAPIFLWRHFLDVVRVAIDVKHGRLNFNMGMKRLNLYCLIL